MKIGVLALQGAVREHIRHIELSGHEGVAVKRVEQLEDIAGLILPGGESTTLRRLMDLYGFKEALQQSDLPMFGTCAGLIVLAKDVEGESGYLKKLDITVERNSFGRQVDSFESELNIKGVTSVFLVSFANFSSIGIISGAIKSLNDKKGDIVARFGLKLLFGATLVSFISAAIAGFFI